MNHTSIVLLSLTTFTYFIYTSLSSVKSSEAVEWAFFAIMGLSLVFSIVYTIKKNEPPL